jgi:CheY-like chemotaxis protein
MSTFPSFEIIPLEQVPGFSSYVETRTRRPLVLVVDDEHVIADTLSIILAKHGFATMTAYDGAEALELMRLAGPDLLLSDVMMGPGMDGTELAVEMVRTYPECKVMLFSGHAATRDLLEKAREAGHDFTLLNKPLHPSDLLARLQQTFPELTAA